MTTSAGIEPDRGPGPRYRQLRWVIGAALLGLLGHGCSAWSGAPCTVDADCLVEGDLCDEGRCMYIACDEGDLRPCAAGANGPCRGLQRCESGVFGACEAPAERCDGVDGDCDGRIDEGFPALGDPCDVGIGACRGVGVMMCTADGMGTACSADEGEARPEVCDGVDGDCDGVVDEEVGAGGACRQGLGACAAEGVEVCDPARGGLVCDAEAGAPTVETCNGADDDCNGRIDDVAGAGEACEGGVGACAVEGVVRCGPDGLACDAIAGQPGLELCGNRVDDDCDGDIDDWTSCVAGCGNGRREVGETCDDGNGADGDGCSATCEVEPGFACLDGPLDTPFTIEGRAGCIGWAPVEVPAWIGGYGVAYAGGAVGFSGEPAQFTVAYSVRAAGPDGPSDLRVGVGEDGRLVAAATADEAIDDALGRFDPLPPGDDYAITFPDAVCADNVGAIDVEFRTLDDCRRACALDVDCRDLGHICIDGRCLPPEPACGDANRDDGEGCDDGNLVDGDGCTAGCAVEPGFVCQPVAPIGPIDVVPDDELAQPEWRLLDDGVTLLQQHNAAPSHVALRVPISPRYITRFTLQVVGFDDDFIGWTIGGGLTPLTAPAQPYLLFSWKQANQSEPGAGPSARGLRVGRVTGPTDTQTLWSFAGENLALLAEARTLGQAPYVKRYAYTFGVIGDSERLEVYVDGVLEFELVDVPLGDGTFGVYVNSQDAVYAALIAPRALDLCAPSDAD